MEGLGLLTGNTVLDLWYRLPPIDGAVDVHGEIVIRMDGTDVWLCSLTHAQLRQLPLLRFQLFSDAFLHLRSYHRPVDIDFWESTTSYIALTASTHAVEHGTGLELIADIRSVPSPLPDQLHQEFVDGILVITPDDDVEPAANVEEEMEMVRYEDGFSERACSICLEDFNIGMEVAKMPCSHFFHTHCIGRWLERSLLCPLCRSHVISNNLNSVSWINWY